MSHSHILFKGSYHCFPEPKGPPANIIKIGIILAANIETKPIISPTPRLVCAEIDLCFKLLSGNKSAPTLTIDIDKGSKNGKVNKKEKRT